MAVDGVHVVLIHTNLLHAFHKVYVYVETNEYYQKNASFSAPACLHGRFVRTYSTGSNKSRADETQTGIVYTTIVTPIDAPLEIHL